MDRIRKRGRSSGRPLARVVTLVGLLLALPGCDGLDLAGLLSTPSSASEGRGVGASDSDRIAGGAGLESVGPDEAMRVYYQFVDDAGRVQFVERLSDVPAAWRDRVGYVEMDRPPPLSPAEARRSWQVSAGRTAELLLAQGASRPRAAVGRGDVVLYYAEWCGYCRQAKSHLDREGVDYELRDVDIEAVKQELREKTGRGGIPVLDFSGEILRGYSAEGYDRAIEAIRS
jgi:glutaredoxin